MNGKHDHTSAVCIFLRSSGDLHVVQLLLLLLPLVPVGSLSRGEDVTVYVTDINQPSLPTPFDSVLVSVLYVSL